MGLSAKQEKDDRFQLKKKEVVEMIKMQAPSMESKVYFSCTCYFMKCQILVNWFQFVIFTPIHYSILCVAYLMWFIDTFFCSLVVHISFFLMDVYLNEFNPILNLLCKSQFQHADFWVILLGVGFHQL